MSGKIINRILLLQLFWIYACSTTNQNLNTDAIVVENQTSEELKALVGKKIVVVGKTIIMKNGAVLSLTNGRNIWMDEMLNWPDGFYISEEQSKTVKVIGVLTERNDLPVFIPKVSSSEMQGIPVPEGTDLKKASHRFIIKEYKWTEVK